MKQKVLLSGVLRCFQVGEGSITVALGFAGLEVGPSINTCVFSRSFDPVVLQLKIASFSKAVSLSSMAILEHSIVTITFFVLNFFNHNFFPSSFIFMSFASTISLAR